jgi:hypothetical protein
MDPALLQQLALGAVPAGIAGSVIFFSLWWSRRAAVPARSGEASSLDFSDARSLLIVLGMGVVLVLMHPLIMSGLRAPMWVVPARRASDWLPIVVTMGTLLALATVLLRGQRLHVWVWALGLSLLTIGFGALASRRLIAETWSTSQAAGYLAGLAIFVFVTAWGMLALLRKPGWVSIAALLIVAGSTANIMAGPLNSLKLAQWAGVSAAVLTPAVLVAFVRPVRALPLAAGALVMLALGSVTLQAVYFGSASLRLTVVSLAMLAASPWCGVLAGSIVKREGWLRAIMQLSAVALPGAIAMGLWLLTQQQADEY